MSKPRLKVRVPCRLSLDLLFLGILTLAAAPLWPSGSPGRWAAAANSLPRNSSSQTSPSPMPEVPAATTA